MKLIIRTLVFHILCIIVFGLIYYNIKDNFQGYKNNQNLIDYIFLSTTIQAGVGFSNSYPTTYQCKLVMIIQQLLMLTTHIITLYIFTL